ncbi:Sodium/glucose cotransporter 1 [Wickerhamomyces ciferrii]|uniref:Sodium/glucose cotransporter 1 n=1 Tax=Wickerhamomyces ciferrii (strain ATCC 14091 / BCRC 22168 / CBS 111 / JCM 3599 / NBRC 0793 / NRRL Y-1031 F-60-10) TaxID=1206466 RepID=K0KJK3_WICCF|nr:Sodium/glucose cotransporter 1 [Wickerhamomyces ciferrii]CCH43156.1 Sodium/glucose cotransporter 1 [Wickerhamomyces ciferrii]
MGHLSHPAANAILYVTYGLLLISGVSIGWIFHDKKTFLNVNGTQKGIPLAFNFVASGLGVGILSTYPQVANTAGLQGLLVYALCGGLPMLLFSFLGPKIRKQCPDGFVLTEWVFHRFGPVAGLYLSACTILTLFLFMVSDVASLQYAINTLTGLNALPVVIVECVVTSIYTAIGGFKVSFITDNIQIATVFILIIIISCAMGTYIDIDTSKIPESGLLKGNKLGWQLIYILVIAIFTNDLFMSGFWLRTFASKTDKDLWIGCSIAAFLMTCIAVIVGIPGIIAVWAGLVDVGDDGASGASFFIILTQLPSWVMGFTLVFIAALSTCTIGSLQSALTSTISNDIFRNKIPIMYIRVIVVLIIVPVIVVGLKVADDVLQIYFIADLLSAAVIPVILLGLSSYFYFLTVFEVIAGGLGGLLTVFIFGTIYYGNAKDGGLLLIVNNGIYGNDWSAFGAFVAAPVGSLLAASIMLGLRLLVLKLISKSSGKPFTALDKPKPKDTKPAEDGVAKKSLDSDLSSKSKDPVQVSTSPA